MTPVVVTWTNNTATVHGKVHKLVLCENCSTEYVYVLEREASAVGTPNSASACPTDDFDPVPCPACGHYQRYMFPKLEEKTTLSAAISMVVIVASACLSGIGAVYWTFNYLQQPSEFVLERLITGWSLFAVLSLIAGVLASIRQAKQRRYDPNKQDQQSRIAKGRSRAKTRAEFDAAQLSITKPLSN